MVLFSRGGYSQIAAKMRDQAIAGRQRNVCNAVVFTDVLLGIRSCRFRAMESCGI